MENNKSQIFSIDPNNPPEIIPPVEFGTIEYHEKSWGSEGWVCNTKWFCGKILTFKKDAKFSMHSHKLKNELFLLKFGKVQLYYYDLSNADMFVKELTVGETAFIPAGQPHQIIALEDSEVIEFSSPHYEPDSYRTIKGNSQKI